MTERLSSDSAYSDSISDVVNCRTVGGGPGSTFGRMLDALPNLTLVAASAYDCHELSSTFGTEQGLTRHITGICASRVTSCTVGERALRAADSASPLNVNRSRWKSGTSRS